MKQPLSNPLRQAFAENKLAGPHPDAGLLSGFAEGALTGRERESVLAHLATCAECREVLGVACQAAPEPEAQPQLVLQPKRTPLWSWLPWAASAAAIVVVASAVLVRELPRKAYEPEQKVAVVTPAPQQNQAPTAEDKISTSTEGSTRLTETIASAEKKSDSRAKQGSIDTTRQKGPVLGGPPVQPDYGAQQAKREAELSAQARVAERSAPAAAKGEAAGVIADSNSRYVYSNQAASNQAYKSQVYSNQGANNQSATNGRNNAQLTANDQLGQSRAKASNNTQSLKVQAQAETVEVEAAQVPAMAPPVPQKAMRNSAALLSSVRPHWRINDAGQVQRSFGGNWETVLGNEKVRFRVVSVVVGNCVWAGGEKSALYRSTDDGATWQQVTLPSKNGSAHVLKRIYFRLTNEGTIETEDGTTWFTADGGKSWH